MRSRILSVFLTIFATSISIEARAEAPTTTLRVLDADGAQLEPRGLHASLSRTLPPELGSVPGPDHDAFSFLVIGAPDASLETLEVLTRDAHGKPLDVIVNFRAEPATCPDGTPPELACRRTAPLRLVGDALDRNHPALKQRSVLAALGGTLRLGMGGKTLLELPVGGPRASRFGSIERLRARLRVLVLRSRAGGPPAVAGSDVGAKQLIERELESAGALWAQCGIELGLGSDGAAERTERTSVELVEPPQTQLLTLGCGMAQAASGGQLRLQSGPRTLTLETHAGESPTSVALRLADALGRGQRPAQVFENQRTAGDALPSADLWLPGKTKWQRAANEPLSSDPTLSLCLTQLDLSDGLSHFGDGDAFAGTLEERTLLRAFDDGDPRSIEVLVVPQFERSERIGESFIVSPGSSLSSSLIIDRSAIAAGARSFALAHELGHVFMAMPGHPDDYGVDQSWSLMDADVADATVFGPRRLSSADCERALSQSGPAALTPLLTPVPLLTAPEKP